MSDRPYKPAHTIKVRGAGCWKLLFANPDDLPRRQFEKSFVSVEWIRILGKTHQFSTSRFETKPTTKVPAIYRPGSPIFFDVFESGDGLTVDDLLNTLKSFYVLGWEGTTDLEQVGEECEKLAAILLLTLWIALLQWLQSKCPFPHPPLHNLSFRTTPSYRLIPNILSFVPKSVHTTAYILCTISTSIWNTSSKIPNHLVNQRTVLIC